MSLTPSQQARYVSLATVYRRQTFGSEMYTKVGEHVPCAIETTSNYDQRAPIVGLVRQDSVSISDSIEVEASSDLRSEDVIFIEPGSGERPGAWYVTTGTAELHQFRSNARRLLVNDCPPLASRQILSDDEGVIDAGGGGSFDPGDEGPIQVGGQ